MRMRQHPERRRPPQAGSPKGSKQVLLVVGVSVPASIPVLNITDVEAGRVQMVTTSFPVLWPVSISAKASPAFSRLKVLTAGGFNLPLS